MRSTLALVPIFLLATVPAFPAAAVAPPLVHIKDFKYAPAPLHVRAGQTVEFVNDDDEPHTVTAADKSFDSEALDTGGTWKHVFAKAGTYAYFCELHPYMKAIVVVGAADAAVKQ